MASAGNRRSRLVYDREQFDDYLVALLTRIRFNDEADHIISGEIVHPLDNFQLQHVAALWALKSLSFTARQLIEDPIGCYV